MRITSNIKISWKNIVGVGGIFVAIVSSGIGFVEYLYSHRDSLKWAYEFTNYLLQRSSKKNEKLIILTSEDGPDESGGAAWGGDDRLSYFSRRVSERPKLIFEEAALGRIRVLLTNNTGRKITIARAEVINGDPYYHSARKERTTKPHIPVYVPPFLSFNVHKCSNNNEFINQGSVEELDFCSEKTGDYFLSHLPDFSSSDELNCALNVHFITDDGIKLHTFMRLWCAELREAFRRDDP